MFLRERSDSEESSRAKITNKTGRTQSESSISDSRTFDLFSPLKKSTLPSPLCLIRGGTRSAPPIVKPTVESKDQSEFKEYKIEDTKAPRLPPEVERGNVEYKLKLRNVSNSRLEHLVTQLQWRLLEGYNEAIYQIGVTDEGFPEGLLKEDLNASLKTLRMMASKLEATAKVLHVRKGSLSCKHYVAEVLIRQMSSTNMLLEIRVAVIGGVASGKSTLIGVLTKGVLDNGFGGARMTVLQHQHELECGGRTSAISHHVLGFDTSGSITNYSDLSPKRSKEIVRESSKLLTFMDTAGHERYLKTTAFGLTGSSPDYAMLVVAADLGIGRVGKEHLGLALALKLPVFVVITKCDKVPESTIQKTCRALKRIFRSAGGNRTAFVALSMEDVSKSLHGRDQFGTSSIPIFPISSVTGTRLNLLKFCLNLLPVRNEYDKLKKLPSEFRVSDSFEVEDVGIVVAGTVSSGVINSGDLLLLGPDSMTGRFEFVRVESVHNKRVPVNSISAGQSATMAISCSENNKTFSRRHALRKGVVLVDPKLKPCAAREVDVDLLILHHPSGISVNYQVFVHAQTVCQQVQIVSMSVPRMRTGHRAKCKLRFMFHAEYLHKGSTIFLRDGKGKGVGTILKLYPNEDLIVEDTDRKDEGSNKPIVSTLPDSPGRNDKTKKRRQKRHMKIMTLNRARSKSEEEIYSDPQTVEGQARMKVS